MTSPTTARLELVREEQQTVPFQPPHYSFDFADNPHATGIAALGSPFRLDDVRHSLTQGNDEWIIAWRGQLIVAAIRIRFESRCSSLTVDPPVVAAQHLHCGLERYLTHLAERLVQTLSLPLSA